MAFVLLAAGVSAGIALGLTYVMYRLGLLDKLVSSPGLTETDVLMLAAGVGPMQPGHADQSRAIHFVLRSPAEHQAMKAPLWFPTRDYEASRLIAEQLAKMILQMSLNVHIEARKSYLSQSRRPGIRLERSIAQDNLSRTQPYKDVASVPLP